MKSNTVARIKKLLVDEGVGVEEAVKQVGISRKRVYEIVRRHGLPTNPMVHPGGKYEVRICQLLACGIPADDVAALYNLSKSALTRVMTATKERIKKEVGDAKGRGDRRGQSGEEAPALPRNARAARSKRPARKAAKSSRPAARRKKKARNR